MLTRQTGLTNKYRKVTAKETKGRNKGEQGVGGGEGGKEKKGEYKQTEMKRKKEKREKSKKKKQKGNRRRGGRRGRKDNKNTHIQNKPIDY